MNKLKKIRLIEPSLEGHNRIYLYYFSLTLLKLNYDIIVYTNLDKIEKIEGITYKNINYIPFIGLPKNHLLKKFIIIINLFITILNLYKARKAIDIPQNIFFCCIDQYMHELMPVFLFNILFPYQFSGLLLASRDNRKSPFFDKRNIIQSKNCQSIGVLDEFYNNHAKKSHPYIINFPDFCDETPPNMGFTWANEIQEKANGRKIISLLGFISPRKGYKTLIETVKTLPSSKYFFIIAGKSSLRPSEYLYITEQFATKENCLFYSENIPTEADFNSLVFISDIIFAAYLNFQHSSNMLAKACLYKKNIITSKGFYMEEIISKYKLGISINQNSSKECAEAILKLSNDLSYKKNACFDEYMKKNSIKKLEESFALVAKNFNSI